MSDANGITTARMGKPTEGDDGADRARRLFRYVHGDEWMDYRAIMAVFADTFFAEFTPDDVVAALARSSVALDAVIAADRLERLASGETSRFRRRSGSRPTWPTTTGAATAI